MIYVVQFSSLLNQKEVAELPKAELLKIKKAIEEKLTTHPDVFGKPLRRSMKGYRSLRSGDYRVIFRIEKNTVKILLIAHRSIVYKNYAHRLM